MKTLIFTLLVSALGMSSTLRAEGTFCEEKLREHVELMQTSEAYFKEVADHGSSVSSFEITQIQKLLTKRYKSLKDYMQNFEGEIPACAPRVLSTAVAIYDFSLVRESLIDNKDLRRVVKGFIKFPKYGLTYYIEDYKFYTLNGVISTTLDELSSIGVMLPDGMNIHTYQKDYDPNIYALSDKAIQGTTSIVAGVARIWGFISDHMKWRSGRLNKNEEAKSIIQSKLKPLDLVFEKRTFVLSNYTIPGHWGHVGIWLGTKEELIELGVWDQEYFAQFRAQVESGKHIVEIRKEGLGYQSIDTFLNLDEIAVTRINGIESRAKAIFSELNDQIGKRYDFKFDARTADKITCAELIAFSYGDIDWHETKTLFQISLRPDDLALLSVTDQASSEFILYFKGNKKGGGFESYDYEAWKSLFKIEKEKTQEELEAERKLAKEKEEQKRIDELYRGA